jgi:uncharacterized protein (UPF0303 family)
MTTLEYEIIEKFQQLDSDAKQRIRLFINQENLSQESEFDYDAWFARAEAIREEIRQENNGVFPQIDVAGILRSIRDGDDE